MNRFTFEEATITHDADLRRLFAENEMDGEIQVSFQREPSFFFASALQGAFRQVYVARDNRSGEVVGVSARAVRPGFINGIIEDVGYLSDMRLDARYRGGTLVARAYRYLEKLHQDDRCRLYFTVIAEGNQQALSTIASGRAGLPPYRDMGRILSPAVNLLRPLPPIVGDFEIVKGLPDLLPEIVACLRRNMRRRQLAPCYAEVQFGDDPSEAEAEGVPWMRDFRVKNFYVAIRDGRVIGVLAKWDQSGFKQNVVVGYKGNMRWKRPIYNALAGAMSIARFPEPGHAFSSFYASFIAIDEDDPVVFSALLRRLYNDYVGSRYAYFLIGLHEADPLTAALDDYHLTPFAGRLFVVHFADGLDAYRQLDTRPPYVEIATL